MPRLTLSYLPINDDLSCPVFEAATIFPNGTSYFKNNILYGTSFVSNNNFGNEIPTHMLFRFGFDTGPTVIYQNSNVYTFDFNSQYIKHSALLAITALGGIYTSYGISSINTWGIEPLKIDSISSKGNDFTASFSTIEPIIASTGGETPNNPNAVIMQAIFCNVNSFSSGILPVNDVTIYEGVPYPDHKWPVNLLGRSKIICSSNFAVVT